MTTQVQFQSFCFKSSQVRVVTDPNQEYWFCGKDVCDILGYTNDSKALKDHCKTKGVTKRYSLTEGGKQELTFINEPNLYRLIIKSRKPEAEPFEAWVFEEVLPQIRKTGQYSQNQQQNLPLIEEKKFTFEFTQSELQDFCWLWFEAFRMNQLLKEIYPALDALGSHFAPEVYSMGVEYGNHINYLTARIHRLVKDINFGDQTKPFEVLQQVLTKPRTKLNYNRRNF